MSCVVNNASYTRHFHMHSWARSRWSISVSSALCGGLVWKEVVWRSGRPPRYPDLLSQNLQLYLNIHSTLSSFLPRKNKNPQKVSNAGHEVQVRLIFEIVWHWIDNSSWLKKKTGQFWFMWLLSILWTVTCPWTYFSISPALLYQTWRAWNGMNKNYFPWLLQPFIVLCTHLHMQ